MKTGIDTEQLLIKPHQKVRKSKRLPYVKQTEKLGGVMSYAENNLKNK